MTLPDVVCVGETMVVLSPVDGSPLEQRPRLEMAIGGAESNVACGLARLGHSAAWVSRLGDDPFGRIIAATLTGHGVDTSGVETDSHRATGIFAKDPHPDGSAVHYYRQGSAATAMGPPIADQPPLTGARLVHLSGITPALSPSCADLVRRLIEPGRRTNDARVSFDVNHRPQLWTRDPADELRQMSAHADLVFVGRDEAEDVWGTQSSDQVRTLLSAVPELVVKDAGHGATTYEGGNAVFVPAPRVTVIEPVGAGDAFASGYISALLHGRPVVQRLRAGHLVAAQTLRSRGDLAQPLAADIFEELLAVDESEWVERASSVIAQATDDRHHT